MFEEEFGDSQIVLSVFKELKLSVIFEMFIHYYLEAEFFNY
jgi:hypothetical protein